jgi:hypothetical protein
MMSITTTRRGLMLLALAALSLLGGCWGLRCDGSVGEPAMSVTPSSVSSGEEVMIVTTFERDVFTGGPVNVRDISGRIKDADGTSIGSFSIYGNFDGERRLSVFGAVLDAMVLDARSVELTFELTPATSGQTLEVMIFADDGGVECSSIDIGTASLEVQD